MGRSKASRRRPQSIACTATNNTSQTTSSPSVDDVLQPRAACLSVTTHTHDAVVSTARAGFSQFLPLNSINISVVEFDRVTRACRCNVQLKASASFMHEQRLRCIELAFLWLGNSETSANVSEQKSNDDSFSFDFSYTKESFVLVELARSSKLRGNTLLVSADYSKHRLSALKNAFTRGQSSTQSIRSMGIFRLLSAPVLALHVVVQAHISSSTSVSATSKAARNAALDYALDGLHFVSGDIITIRVLNEDYLYTVSSLLPSPSVSKHPVVYRIVASTRIDKRETSPHTINASNEAVLDPQLRNHWHSLPESLYERIGCSRNTSLLPKAVLKVWSKLHLRLYGKESNSSISRSYGGAVLIYGPPGTGKTFLAREISFALKARLLTLNSADIVSDTVGESERALRRVFEEASSCVPALVFLDEIDVLCPSSTHTTSSSDTALHARLVCTLVTILDELRDGVAVLAATNRPNSIEPCLRRPGRLATEVELPIPDVYDREAILNVMLHQADVISLTPNHVLDIAQHTHGFVGADLRALCHESALHALSRNANCHTPQLLHNDFVKSLACVRPSALRELIVEVPRVQWSDIAGQSEAKNHLAEAIEWPLLHRQSFERLGIRPPCGLLLYGPPGCSKTMLARALASETKMNFIVIKGPELLSKWVGQSERAVRDLFTKARQAAPAIVFFDEIDAIASARCSGESGSSVSDRVLSQLLSEMDGVESRQGVVVVAATNRPSALDLALLRPGRLDRLLYVAPPDAAARRELLRRRLNINICDDETLAELCVRTEGFSGAEIVALLREAAVHALELDTDASQILPGHVLHILKTFRSRLRPELLEYYARFQDNARMKMS